MSGPRVLLCARPGTGGSARVIEALLRRLPERGIGGTAALSGLEGDRLLETAAAHGWSVERVDMERPIRPWRDLKAGLRLRALLPGHDLVHAHAAKAAALARLATRGSVPVLYSPHGFYFDYHAAGSRPRERFLRMERRLAKWTSALHCVSDHEREIAIEHGLATAETAFAIPNPVPPGGAAGDGAERFRDLGVAPGEPVVLMAARLAEPKDPTTFLAASAHVDAPCRFVLAGDGPLFDATRAAAPPQTILAGHQDDVRSLLRAARICVLASGSEALPLALVEAMVEGVPCVATDIPGCRAACGDAALYVPPGDPVALGRAIEQLLTDAALHARLATAARARARLFDEDHWLDAMVALYATVGSRS